MRFLGIDFGAKRAGTTVGCALGEDGARFERCKKGADADEFVMTLINEVKPALVGIDAPLSLPAVYRGSRYAPEADYFYRECDRALGAMSPLFLGGLTARAIRLKALIESAGYGVIEVYPAALLREIGDDFRGLSKDRCGGDGELLAEAVRRIARWGAVSPPSEPSSWHDIDSLLAVVSTVRHHRGLARTVGHAEEGLIIV